MINNIIVIRRFTHTHRGLRFSILQTSLRRLFYFFPCDNKVERLVIYYGYKCRLLTFFPLGDIVARFRFFRRRFPGLTDATFQFSFLLQFLSAYGARASYATVFVLFFSSLLKPFFIAVQPSPSSFISPSTQGESASTDFSKTLLRFTDGSLRRVSCCVSRCPFSFGAYENLQRAFSEASIRAFVSRGHVPPSFSALIRSDTRFAAASSFHPAALLARRENIYGVSQSPPSQFIRYRDPRRVASFGSSTLAVAFGLFTAVVSKARVLFLSPGGYGERPTETGLTSRAGTRRDELC